MFDYWPAFPFSNKKNREGEQEADKDVPNSPSVLQLQDATAFRRPHDCVYSVQQVVSPWFMCVCDHAVTSLRFDIAPISPPVLGAVSVVKGLELENVNAPLKDIIGLAG